MDNEYYVYGFKIHTNKEFSMLSKYTGQEKLGDISLIINISEKEKQFDDWEIHVEYEQEKCILKRLFMGLSG